MSDVLFLAHRVPFPPDRGDKIRAFHVLRHLASRARVHLIAFADDLRDMTAGEALGDLVTSCTIVPRRKSRPKAAIEALLTRRPISLTAFDDPKMRKAVATLLAAQPIDTIYAFSGQMAQYLSADRSRQIVMDFVDMDSAKFADYARGGIGPLAWLMAREARRLGDFERDVASRVDASLFVSDAEAELFRAGGASGCVEVVANGIDTNVFDPAATYERIATDGPLIVFTGQMDYPPNVDAVTWFAQDILPHVRARHPMAHFAIVGRSPTAAVRALAKVPGVIVTGEVADVRGWLAAASVVVAPLKIARGVQNKVLEAMAMAQPVVASSAAAEGIDHGGTLRVGGDALALAEAVAALLDDPAGAAALGQSARARVIARYDWAARLAPLDALLGLSVQDLQRSAA